MSSYKTIDGICIREITVERSRFIAAAAHVESEQEAADFIAKKRAEFHDARHNVFAYSLASGISRFSDDGEPHGTAGKPILDVVLGSGISDVCVVVTRYFGGVLLGTGGLVRAYSSAAKLALESCDTVTMLPCFEYTLRIAYSDYDYLQKTICKYGDITAADFSEEVAVTIAVREECEEEFLQTLEKLFYNRVKKEKKKEKIFVKIKVF